MTSSGVDESLSGVKARLDFLFLIQANPRLWLAPWRHHASLSESTAGNNSFLLNHGWEKPADVNNARWDMYRALDIYFKAPDCPGSAFPYQTYIFTLIVILTVTAERRSCVKAARRGAFLFPSFSPLCRAHAGGNPVRRLRQTTETTWLVPDGAVKEKKQKQRKPSRCRLGLKSSNLSELVSF